MIVRVRLQPLVESLLMQLITGELQPSSASTLFGLRLQSGMLDGLRPRSMLAGQVMNVGAVVSVVQKMCWMQLLLLPQASVATYVIVRSWKQRSAETESDFEQLMTGVPQSSVAAT